MKYQLSNGKNITIPDEEIQKGVDLLGLTREESIQMYLEDNEYEFNYEQEELQESTKGQRIDHGSTDKTKRKAPTKPKVYKNSDEKVALFLFLKEQLEKFCNDNGYALSVVKNEKMFSLQKDSTKMTVDIVEARKKKT